MCDATFCFLALSLLAKHFILFFIISSLILKKEHGIKKEIRLVFSCPFRVLRWGYYYFPTVFHSFYFSLDSTFLYLFYIILKTKYNRTRFILSLYLSLFNELLFFYHYRLICSFFFFFFLSIVDLSVAIPDVLVTLRFRLVIEILLSKILVYNAIFTKVSRGWVLDFSRYPWLFSNGRACSLGACENIVIFFFFICIRERAASFVFFIRYTLLHRFTFRIFKYSLASAIFGLSSRGFNWLARARTHIGNKRTKVIRGI